MEQRGGDRGGRRPSRARVDDLEGRGFVADVSDFLEGEEDAKWRDLKAAYYRVYRPLLMPLRLRVPDLVLNSVRAGYRLFRRAFPGSS